MNNWDDINYQKIHSAEVNDNRLTVVFANGDVVDLPLASLLPVGIDYYSNPEANATDFDISVRSGEFETLIPWDRIRTLSDKYFAREMAEQAEENARKTGERIKSLRERKMIKANLLAEMAGVTPQTISRIEKGHTDVSFGTLRRILAAMGYGLKDLANEESFEPAESGLIYWDSLIRKLGKVGIDFELLKKIIPSGIGALISNKKDAIPELVQDEIGTYLSRVFGWTGKEIWNSDTLTIDNSSFKTALYKTPTRGNVSQIRAYSHYAFYLSNVVQQANSSIPEIEYPGDLNEFKNDFYREYNSLSFKNLISFAWDLGVCVIPLNDQGVFHGASWNIQDKHVIILKQRNESHARWIFDLLHELYHVFAHLDEPNSSVVEMEEVNPFDNNASLEEREANTFANRFIFGERSEDIARSALLRAEYKIELLKNSVKEIAEEEGISADFIANYLAFRLQMTGKNWWGTANNFQIVHPSPFVIAREELKSRISIETLNPIDQNMLNSALQIN